MRIAEPVPGGPGIDVEILRLAVRVLRGVHASAISHFSELPDQLVDRIEITFAHLDPVSEHVPSLVRVFRGPHTLTTVVSRTEVVLVIDKVRFDQEPGYRFDLIVENEHADIAHGILALAGRTANIRIAAADWCGLVDIRFCIDEIPGIA